MAQKGAHPKPAGYWLTWRNVKRELLAYKQKHRQPGIMPPLVRLQQQGYGGLASAIKRLGGARVVARRLKLRPEPRVYKNLPGHWTWERTLNELRAFISQHDLPENVLPNQAALLAAKRGDLANGIRRLGGARVVRKRLGLGSATAYKAVQRPETKLKILKRELPPVMAKRRLKSLPSTVYLIKAGRADLVRCIRLYGGTRQVAQALGLPITSPQSRRASQSWRNFQNLAREVRAFMKAREQSGTLPSERMMQHTGRGDLSSAVATWGRREVARRMG